MPPIETPPLPALAAAPLARDLPEQRPAPPPRRDRLPLKLLGLSVLLFTLTVGIASLVLPLDANQRALSAAGFAVSAFTALAGIMSALWVLIGVLRRRYTASLWRLLAALFGNGVMAFIGSLAALLSAVDFRRGRQLRSFGKVLLPPVVSSSDWAASSTRFEVDDSARPALAHQWRENGRTEHASVAAFARHTLDLLALGAPPSLVAAAQRDALDEIRHAQLCFALARSIDGVAESPGAFPEIQKARALSSVRSVALAQLAVDSLLDGALHEGVSARVLAKLARRAEDERIRAVLKELAADEGRHAAHGWEVVEWCVAVGGEGVIDALAGAVRALPEEMRSPLPEGARDGAWEKYGIHGWALEREEYAKAREKIAERVGELKRARAA